MICFYCSEKITPFEERANIQNFDAHRECALRSVMGGIGHQLDHSHFCGSELGPDAGLDYRTSALMVDVHFARRGFESEETS